MKYDLRKKQPARLQRIAFKLALKLAECDPPTVSATELSRILPTAAAHFLESGSLSEIEHARTIVPVGGSVEVSVEWREDIGRHAYFSRSGWVAVDSHRLKRYKLNAEWIARQIMEALLWPQQLKPVALIDDILWDCGQSYIGKRKAGLFFCRRIGHGNTFDLIAEKLSVHAKSGANILFSASPVVPRHMKMPGVEIMPVAEALNQQHPDFSLDTGIIENALFGRRPEENNQPIVCKASGGVLIINGREFVFKGDKQRQVVQYLYEKFLKNELPTRLQEMLSDLEFPDNTRLRDLFKKHPDWDKAIHATHGSCTLIIS